jgi:hypothetical protein
VLEIAMISTSPANGAVSRKAVEPDAESVYRKPMLYRYKSLYVLKEYALSKQSSERRRRKGEVAGEQATRALLVI